MGAPKAKMVLRGHRKHISGLALEADELASVDWAGESIGKAPSTKKTPHGKAKAHG